MKKTILLLFVLSIYSALYASIWRVNNDPNVSSDFKTLQEAINNASAGDTLYVEGTQFDYLCDSITKQLVIYGPGYFLAENDSLAYQPAPAVVKGTNGTIDIRENAAYTKIYGLKITPGSRINVLANHITIARNYIDLPNLDRLEIKDHVSYTCIKQNYINGNIELNNSLNNLFNNYSFIKEYKINEIIDLYLNSNVSSQKIVEKLIVKFLL